MNNLEFLMMQVLWFLYHIRYYTITFSTKHNSFLHAVTGSSSGLLLLNIVSLWFGAVEVTEAEVVAAAAGASGCGCWPELLVKLAAVCCNVKETTFRYILIYTFVCTKYIQHVTFCLHLLIRIHIQRIHWTIYILSAFVIGSTYYRVTQHKL